MNQELKLEVPDYKIFDFHRHISKDLEEFEKNLNQFNIDKFCIMPSMIAGNFKNIEGYIKNLGPYIQKYQERAIIFGCLDFSQDFKANFEILQEQRVRVNIKGIKIHPDQGFKIEKKRLSPYFNAISKVLGKAAPIYIHMDWPLLEKNRYAPQGKKRTFNKLVSFFPEFKFIMGHAGGSGDYLNIWKSCKRFSNVFIETSMAPVTSTLSEVMWKVGPERLVFGSNYPYCGTNIELVKILNLYKVSEENKRKILESNWKFLLEN